VSQQGKGSAVPRTAAASALSAAPETHAGVPLQDPARENAELDEALTAAARSVVAGGKFILGPHVERFEAEVAAFLGVRYAIGVASGSDALRLTLEALGVGPGDEVITSAFSFISTAGEILHAGATPVFIDIHSDSFNLDPAAVADAITERTAAIVPVHMFGQMAAMQELRALAQRHGLAIVEDAAQAFGATQRQFELSADARSGRPERGTVPVPNAAEPVLSADAPVLKAEEPVLKAGAVGDAGCLSFYPTKNLGAWGDGGMVITSDAEVARRVRLLRAHGRAASGTSRREAVGYNSRLDALQAAVLTVKLDHVQEWNERRRVHAAAYDEGLRAANGIATPPVQPGNRHVYQQYTLRCSERSAVVRKLEALGIGYGIYYPLPLHLEEPLRAFGRGRGSLPEAELAAREVLSLPVFPALRPDERSRVIAALS